MKTFQFLAKRLNEKEFSMTTIEAKNVKQVRWFSRSERFQIKGFIREL